MCDDTLSKLSRQVEHLAARQTAFETVLLEVIAPILLQTIPDLALELVDAIRTDLHVTTSSGHSTLQLNTEKHIQSLADRLERLIRAPQRAQARPN